MSPRNRGDGSQPVLFGMEADELLRKGLSEARAGDTAAAKATLQAALGSDPTLYAAHAMLAQLRAADGEHHEAREDLCRAARMASMRDRRRLLRLASAVCREGGDWTGLVAVLRELVDADDNPAIVIAEMDDVCRRLGRLEAAAGSHGPKARPAASWR